MPIRSSRGCAAQLDKVQGARLFLQAAQDVRVGGRASRTQFQFTLQSADIDQLNEWAPKILEQTPDACLNCATSQPISKLRV